MGAAVLCAMVVTGIPLAACAQYGGTVAQQVAQWSTMTQFPTEAAALRGDIARIDDLGSDSVAGIERTDCDVLVTDALTANQNLPAPDAALTGLLSRAYSLDGEAGRDCLSGADGNASLLARSADERVAGTRELVKAMARIDELGPA